MGPAAASPRPAPPAAPRVKTSRRLSAGLPCTLGPEFDQGVGSACTPAAANSRCTTFALELGVDAQVQQGGALKAVRQRVEFLADGGLQHHRAGNQSDGLAVRRRQRRRRARRRRRRASGAQARAGRFEKVAFALGRGVPGVAASLLVESWPTEDGETKRSRSLYPSGRGIRRRAAVPPAPRTTGFSEARRARCGQAHTVLAGNGDDGVGRMVEAQDEDRRVRRHCPAFRALGAWERGVARCRE